MRERERDNITGWFERLNVRAATPHSCLYFNALLLVVDGFSVPPLLVLVTLRAPLLCLTNLRIKFRHPRSRESIMIFPRNTFNSFGIFIQLPAATAAIVLRRYLIR